MLGPYFWRGEAKTKGMAHVLGMFPGKSLKSGVPEMGFQAVWGGNKSIGKVTLENWWRGPCSYLFSLYDAGREKPNFILIGMLHLGWFIDS